MKRRFSTTETSVKRHCHTVCHTIPQPTRKRAAAFADLPDLKRRREGSGACSVACLVRTKRPCDTDTDTGMACKRTCVRSPLEEELVQLKHEVHELRAFRRQAYKVLAGQSARVRQLENQLAYQAELQRASIPMLVPGTLVTVH
jgi:hypothetical protein